MLKGFSTPLSPRGVSSTAPSPPWHYVADYLAVEFWADPDAVRAVLPQELEPGPDPGRCAIFFSDCQYATDGRELVEPAISQYRECMVVITALVEGKPGSFIPYIFVDNDNSMVRGHIQGMPKQLGVVRLTRSFDVASPASAVVGPGGAFGATASYRDRLVAQAAVTLRETTDQAPNRIMARLVNRRHFPDLREGRHDSPLVSELVRQKTRDVTMSTIWTGDASLSLPASSVHELGDLSPVRVGPGYRYTMAMTIDDLAVLGSAVPPIR